MLFDSHCHLIDSRYGKDACGVVEEAKQEGVSLFLNIATSKDDSKSSSEISKKIREVYSTVGIYPHSDIGLNISEILPTLENIILENPKVVAIGECGIDVSDHNPQRPVEEQKELFVAQIELSIKHNLTLVIHNRGGDSTVLDILKNYHSKGLKAVAHCFSSDWDTAQKFLDLGMYLSFSGMITYPSNNTLRDVVKNVPDDRFLIETDSPWLPPQGHRGELNHPKYVKIVAEKVSQVKEKPYLTIASLSTSNACRLFSINL